MICRFEPGTVTSPPNQPPAFFSRRPWIVPSLLALTVALSPTGACAQVYDEGLALANCINQYDYQRSISGCSEIIENSENQGFVGETYRQRGLTYSRHGLLDTAIADYSKAIEIIPNFKRTYVNRANAYREKNRPRDAIKDLDKALNIDPNYEHALYLRGVLYVEHAWDETEIDLAIEDLEKAVAIDPYHAGYYGFLGAAYAAKGDGKRATENWHKAIEIDPDSQPAKGLLEKWGKP